MISKSIAGSKKSIGINYCKNKWRCFINQPLNQQAIRLIILRILIALRSHRQLKN